MAIKNKVYVAKFYVEYWKIISHTCNELTKIGVVTLGGFFDKDARVCHDQPFSTVLIYIKASEYKEDISIAELYQLVMQDEFFKHNEGIV